MCPRCAKTFPLDVVQIMLSARDVTTRPTIPHSDLSTCGIPILQLERPKRTEHYRLGDIVPGVLTPVLAKHSTSFSLVWLAEIHGIPILGFQARPKTPAHSRATEQSWKDG